MAECEVYINEFDELTWDGKSLRSVFVSRGWTNICTLRRSVYPSMAHEFYMEMSSMPQDASSHIVTIRGVWFEVLADVIAQLLRLHRVSEASSTVDTQAKGAPNVGPSASYVDSIGERYVDRSEGEDTDKA